MTERASIFQTVQLGVESTPGTSVAANKLLQSMSIEPAIRFAANSFRPAGTKFPTVVAPNQEWITAKLSGAPVYDELIYPLSSVLAYAAPVQQGATTAYKWTFAPAYNAADTVKTFTVEQGSSVRAHKFTYGLVSAFGISVARDGVELDGEMLGKALTDSITMTAAPTTLPLVPILPTQFDVYVASSYAGLAGASPLTRVISAEWKVSDRFGPVWALASANGTSFAATVETEPKVECKLKMQADAEGMAQLTNLRAGSSIFLRLKAVGALIASTYYYTFQIDTATKIVEEPSEFSDEDGVFAVEWNLTGVYDATWGKATQIELTNTQTSL